MTKGSYYIGLDPSFSAFGIAVIDTLTQTIYLDQLKSDNHHNFVLMSWAVANLYNDFADKYKYFLYSEDTYIAQEAPIASGINSGKLNALGIHFYLKAGKESSYNRIKTYHPMKLKSFHHKKKYTKQDTIEVVNKILEYFESIGYTVKVVKSRTKKSLTLTDGECDAFMYAVKTYMDCRPEAKSTRDLLEMYPRFEVFKSIEESMQE
jgi:hypothetical protein